MAKKHVCVSFDFEHDKNYYYLLKAIPILNLQLRIVHREKFKPNRLQRLSKYLVQKLVKQNIWLH